MLTLTRDLCTRQNYLWSSPVGIVSNFLRNVVVQESCQPRHKCGSRCYTIRIKWIQRNLLAFQLGFFQSFAELFCCAESSLALLIHLCSRGRAINSKEQEILGSHNFDKIVDELSDSNEHLLFGKMNHFTIVPMSARVNNA